MTHTRDSSLEKKTGPDPVITGVDEVTVHDDVAAGFLAKIAQEEPELLEPWTPAEEKKLLRWKIDPIVLTLSQFALMMGAVDKVCIGTAAVIGMRADLNLVGQQYNWISSIIYFGAITAVFPSLFIMQKVPVGKYIAGNCMVWGVILLGSAGSTSFAGLAAARFVLGLFEAVIYAGFGMIVSAWWTREEQPWRTAVIFSTLSSVINGLLSYGCAHYSGPIAQWRVLFLAVGAITLGWGILCWFFLAGQPLDAFWLNNREKIIAIRRTAANNTGIGNKVLKMSGVIEAVKDPKTWFVFAINICLNIPNNGVLTFNSIIVSALGFSRENVMLLAIPTGIISWISSIVFGWIAVKSGFRCGTAIIACLVPMAGTIILYLVPRSNIGGSLAGLYILFCYWGPYIVVMSIMYANTASHTKKTVVYAISYIGYCTGNLIGPQCFDANQAPKYEGGVAAMLSCYAVAILLIALYWIYIIYLRKSKATQLAEWESKQLGEDLLEEWHDQSDWENPKFKYIY